MLKFSVDYNKLSEEDILNASDDDQNFEKWLKTIQDDTVGYILDDINYLYFAVGFLRKSTLLLK